MLLRGQHVSRRLFKLSLRSSNIYNSNVISVSSLSIKCTASHRLASSSNLNISTSQTQYPSPVSNRLLHLRSFSHVPSSPPPIPQDEYEELKSFLAEPATSGASMDRAKEIVSSWMQQYVHPAMPGQEATVMVMVADSMQDPEFVMNVYTCLRDAGVSPSPLTLEYSAAACAKLGQWRTALEVIEFMHEAVEIMQPSLTIYENAIMSCHAAKKWMRAKHLLEEMRTYGLEASPELHVASIRLCIDNNEATATKVLLQAFLRAYDEELDREEKHEILTGLFHAAIDAQSLSQALNFRDELMARHYHVSKKLYSRLVHLCAVKRQWHKARVLLQQFVDVNAPPPTAARSNRYTDDIRRLLEDMQTYDIEIPLVVYNAALRNFGQSSLGKDAMAVYSGMRDHRVAPDATSFAALMCSCGTQVKQSEGFFRELLRDQCDPTLDVAHAYLLVPSRAKQWEEVLRRYAVLHDEDPLLSDLPFESDVRIQSLVAVAYGRLHRSEEMLRVFTKMKVNGMKPNLHVYGEAMFAYIRQDQWRYALMLFDHLFQQQTPEMQEKRMLENFPMLWDATVLACVQGEQTERAAMLYDTIVEQGVSISMVTGERLAAMLTSVPSETLWRSFKSIPSLHRTQTRNRLNPRVQNAMLKRAVEENDTNLAEQIVTDGIQKMNMLPNSMTYALMLRLYANRGNQKSFYSWWCRMNEGKVKPTLFVFRALMQQLCNLSLECEDLAYLNAIGDFLRTRQPRESISAVVNVENTREHAAELGRVALDVMESCGMGPDTICLQNYLLLSQESDHVARALVLVENTMSALNEHDENSDEECVHLTPRLLHTLITALSDFPDGQRVRQLLIQIVKDLPSDLSEDAVAAFCAANDGYHALQLLRELLDAKICLNDDHILFFLTNSYTCESSSQKSQHSRPRSAYGVIVDMSSQLCESDTVTMEAGCLAFLIQHIVKLSKWQQQDVFETATQDEIDAMKKLLVRAFAHFPISQVSEFLSKVIAEDDLVHVVSVLDELQGAEENQ